MTLDLSSIPHPSAYQANNQDIVGYDPILDSWSVPFATDVALADNRNTLPTENLEQSPCQSTQSYEPEEITDAHRSWMTKESKSLNNRSMFSSCPPEATTWIPPTRQSANSVWNSDSVNAYSFPGSQGDQSSAQFTSQSTLPPAQVHTDNTSHPVANQASHTWASNANPVPYMLQSSSLAPYTESSHQNLYPATNSTNTSVPWIQATRHGELEGALGPNASWLSPANNVSMAVEGGSCLDTQPDEETTSLAPYTESSHQSLYPATDSTNTSLPATHGELEGALGPNASWSSPANEMTVTGEGGSCLDTQSDEETMSLSPSTESSHQSLYPATSSTNTSLPATHGGLEGALGRDASWSSPANEMTVTGEGGSCLDTQSDEETTSPAPSTGSSYQSLYPATSSTNTSLPATHGGLEGALGRDAPWSSPATKVTVTTEGGSCLDAQVRLQPDKETSPAPYTESSHQSRKQRCKCSPCTEAAKMKVVVKITIKHQH